MKKAPHLSVKFVGGLSELCFTGSQNGCFVLCYLRFISSIKRRKTRVTFASNAAASVLIVCTEGVSAGASTGFHSASATVSGVVHRKDDEWLEFGALFSLARQRAVLPMFSRGQIRPQRCPRRKGATVANYRSDRLADSSTGKPHRRRSTAKHVRTRSLICGQLGAGGHVRLVGSRSAGTANLRCTARSCPVLQRFAIWAMIPFDRSSQHHTKGICPLAVG